MLNGNNQTELHHNKGRSVIPGISPKSITSVDGCIPFNNICERETVTNSLPHIYVAIINTEREAVFIAKYNIL